VDEIGYHASTEKNVVFSVLRFTDFITPLMSSNSFGEQLNNISCIAVHLLLIHNSRDTPLTV